MATDFDKNAIVMNGGIKPSTKDTPGDVRTRIESVSEVELIPLPFVGMIFFVKDEGQFYVVKSLKGKKVGPVSIPDSVIDEFEPLFTGLASEEFVQEALQHLELPEGLVGPQGPEGPQGIQGEPGLDGMDGFTPVKGVDYFTEEELAELKYDDSELKEMINNEVRAREAFVEEKIAELVNGAPETMNTLHELAKAVKEHEDVCEAYVQVNNEALAAEAEERKAADKAIRELIKKEIDLIHEEMVEEVGLINQEMEEEIEKVNDVITEQVQKLNSEHTEHVVTLYGKCKDLRLRVETLETLNLETKPYIDDNGMLVLCGCPAIARGVGEEVHVVTRFFNDEEDKFVFSKDEFAKLRICMGYGAEGVGAKRASVETTLELYDIDKVFIIDAGSQITGEIGTVNIIAERCNYIDGIQGARAMNGGEKNLVHNFNVKVKDVKLIDTLFAGGNGYAVVWNSNVVVEGDTTINYLIAGGSNGFVRKSHVELNGGHAKVMQGVNRGILDRAELIVNGGEVDHFYVGGENDPTVTGKQNESHVELLSGVIHNFHNGTSELVDLKNEDIKGIIKEGFVVENGDVSMLEEVVEPKPVEKLVFIENVSNVEIELPEVEDFEEVHVFVKYKSGSISIKNDACRWQSDMPELVEGRVYELVFTKVANMWLAGCIEYK